MWCVSFGVVPVGVRLVRVLALGIVVALLVSSCWGGDSDDEHGVDLEWLKAPEDWDPQELPPRPDDEESIEGAARFAGYVLRLGEYASATNDFAALEDLTPDPDDCEVCVALREASEADPERTVRFAEPFEILLAEIDADSEPPFYAVYVATRLPDRDHVDGETGQIIEPVTEDAPDAFESQFPDENEVRGFLIVLTWENQQWMMSGFLRSLTAEIRWQN